ncbi:MAG: hypothetical protein WDZ49_02670 [Litorilinea sp.]
MNLIRWFAGLFSGGGGGSKNGRILPVYVLSRRCNEPIAGQVDLYNELSLDEEETGYFCRKVLHTSGESRCFDQVEVSIWFDNRKNMTEHEVSGGRWLSEAEYEQELVRFHAPPEEDDEDFLPALNASKQRTAQARRADTAHAEDHDSGDSDGGGDDSD